MKLPAVSRIRQLDTHRLIPAKYGESGDSVLIRIADNDDHLRGIFELDLATDKRLAAEADRLPGIGVDELVAGIPHHHVINAAFSHAHPLGSRFNGPDRGAWYAAFDLATSQAEVSWHKWIELVEVDWTEESVTYDDYLADFGGEFHDVRGDPAFDACLDPHSYVESQLLAETLLAAGVARGNLSQRASRRRYLSRVLPTRAGGERPQERALPFYVEGITDTRDRCRRNLRLSW